ncbi:hypothetical protein [Streptomyces sp. NBC_01353]|nr:hypothetical protein [Streptomyces sp. NBC_01353]
MHHVKGTATTPLGRIPLAAAPEGLREGIVLLRPEQLQLAGPGTTNA